MEDLEDPGLPATSSRDRNRFLSGSRVCGSVQLRPILPNSKELISCTYSHGSYLANKSLILAVDLC